MNPEIAVVAGTNELKVKSTQMGLRRLSMTGCKDADVLVYGRGIPDSPVIPPQPFGLKQTRQGALYRALTVLSKAPEATFGVGIENGIIFLDEEDPGLGGLDIPVVAVIRRATLDRVTYGSGQGVLVEGNYILKLLAANQQQTCGKEISAETGFDHANWHKNYLGEASERGETVDWAVFFAFAAHFAGRFTLVK